jgi:hypothetical protein
MTNKYMSIEEINRQVAERFEKVRLCEEKGHPFRGIVEYVNDHQALVRCSFCGRLYSREPTDKDLGDEYIRKALSRRE